MSFIYEFLRSAIPDQRIWWAAFICGVPIALFLVWWARRFKKPNAPILFLLLLMGSATSYLAMVVAFVYADGAHTVVGGYSLTPKAVEFMSSQDATTLDAIAAFDGWNNPDAVWLPVGRWFIYVILALLASLVIGSFLAFALRYSASLKKLLSGLNL